MIETDRISDYLRQLTPQARSNLLIELERLEASGAAVPRRSAAPGKLARGVSQKQENASARRQSIAAFLQSGGVAAGRWRART